MYPVLNFKSTKRSVFIYVLDILFLYVDGIETRPVLCHINYKTIKL